MRTEIFIAALIMLGESAVSAHAGPSPQFSAVEARTIGRNELLTAVVQQDPWLVRRILDLLEKKSAGAAASGGPDPDLTTSPRDWQGIVEWNELIKRARAEKDAREKPAAGMSRSSEGTVEMIDMMRRAKEKKASTTP